MVLGTVPAEGAPSFDAAETSQSDGRRFAATLPPNVGVPTELANWTGKRLVIFGEADASTACTATVRAVRLSAVIDTMEGFEPVGPLGTATAIGDATFARQIAQMTDHRMVLGELEFSGDCSIPKGAASQGRAPWARLEGTAFMPLISPTWGDSDDATAVSTTAKATAAFRKLPLWKKVQRDWAKTEDAKTTPLWDEGVGISVVTVRAADRDWVYLSASGTCIFPGAAWALWEIGASGKWTLRTSPSVVSEPPSIYAVADLDGDGQIELISTAGIVSGKNSVWTTVLDTRVDWMGCAC